MSKPEQVETMERPPSHFRKWNFLIISAAVVGVVSVVLITTWQQQRTSVGGGLETSSRDSTIMTKNSSSSSSVTPEHVDSKQEEQTTPTTKKKNNNAHHHVKNNETPVGAYYQLVETLVHDPLAFTQGLVYWNGTMYEGTGLHGSSELRRVDIPTGAVVQRHVLDRHYFGEGVAFYQTTHGEARLLQLTWQEQIAFIYDAETFQVLQQFSFTTTTNEGWGVTYNPHHHEFIVSDGSDWLHIWDANTMKQVRRVKVTMMRRQREDGGANSRISKLQQVSVKHLNELEFDPHHDDGGTVLANLWYQDVIVRIDLETGHVVRVYDFSKLHTQRNPGEDCFNGIALAEAHDELYVTGKKWPAMYRVKLLF